MDEKEKKNELNESNDDIIKSAIEEEEDAFIKEEVVTNPRLVEIEKELQEIEINRDLLDGEIVKLQEQVSFYEYTEDDEKQLEKMKNQYKELKLREKDLYKEKKQIVKGSQTGIDALHSWIIIYGIIQFIICLPFISYNLWYKFASLVGNFFDTSTLPEWFVSIIVYVLVFAIPLLLLGLSWLLYVNVVKSEVDKKVFKIIWILQALASVALGIYLVVA